MIEYNKPVSNPMLMGAIELMKAENTPERKKMVSDEIAKARFLTPASVTPVPEPDANGETRLGPENRVNIPILASSNGKPYFMAFTDMAELKKWRDEEGQQTLAMSFDDYAAMMFNKESNGNPSPATGIVINPFGINIIIPKEAVAQYIATKVAKATGRTTPPNQQK